LIGQPMGIWPSLVVYNTAFAALGLNWRYVPLPMLKGQLREALYGLRALGFAGAEVSESHQNDVLDYLEELSPAAETIGAASLVWVNERGRLVGDNLRWCSFLWELRTMVSSLNGLRPLVIGAGDAARDIVYALAREGLPITIISQRMEQAINLVHRLRHVLDEHSFNIYRWPHDLARVASDANLIVNSTSVGLRPDIDGSPWPDKLDFAPDAIVFDLAYWPGETRFLRQARSCGLRTINGLRLLVYEAVLTCERWTGQTPPLQVMLQTARQALTVEPPSDSAWSEAEEAFAPSLALT
jgi:shikimate dehydrogenase